MDVDKTMAFILEAQAAPRPSKDLCEVGSQGGAKLDQIQLSLGHASLTTTERYLGVHQDLHDAPCDYIRLDLSAAE